MLILIQISIDQCEGIVREIFRDLDLKIFNEKFKAGSCALIALYDKSTNELWTINLGKKIDFEFIQLNRI